MPLTLSDIQVPAIRRKNKHGDEDHYCTLCDEKVGYDYNYQAMPHRLDECLGKLKEKLQSNGLPK